MIGIYCQEQIITPSLFLPKGRNLPTSLSFEFSRKHAHCGWTMKLSKDEINKARADYCVSQAALAKDDEIKKFWDDLANEWLDIHAKSQVEPPQVD